MPADRLLGTLLRSLSTYTDQQDTPRLLGTAASLLTTLNNPLNVTLLSSRLLFAPAIWARPDGLQTCMRCLSVFHSAAQALIRHETALQEQSPDRDFARPQLERTLPKDDWIRAVVSGADEHSPRWRHLLILGGLLLGFGPVEEDRLSRSMRSTLEQAFTTAVNASLQETPDDDELGQQTITAVVNHCFPLLSVQERSLLDYDRLLPIMMRSMLHSSEGLRSAYFLGAVDMDVQPVSNTQFRWSERSPSYQQVQSMLSSPLLASLGPLSRLIGHAVESVRNPWLVTATLDDLETFSRTLCLQWRRTKLSEIDASEENIYLDQESLSKTIPALWKLLRSTMYAAVIVLRSALGRLLGDTVLATDDFAPRIASQALHTLRYLYFITLRLGSTTFSQYAFANLTALDVLSSYPAQAEAFLQSIKPSELGRVPQHPLERSLDLFFLNTSEHFTLVLPSKTAEELLMTAATPYLAAGGNNNLLLIFEAAHSVVLATFSAPQNTELTLKNLPFYVDALFKVFPHNLSARQFQFAFKTLLRLTTPPSLLFTSNPMLPSTLLELLYARSLQASTVPLFPQPASLDPDAPPEAVIELSEQAALTLTTIDTLPSLTLDLLGEWLPLAAEMINRIDNDSMREHCKEQFWHVLIDGEMDPDRSQLCAAWWTTSGGREMVLFGREVQEEAELEMSGALPAAIDSKL